MENIFVYVPKKLRDAIDAAADKAGLTNAKWLLMLAEREMGNALADTLLSKARRTRAKLDGDTKKGGK